MSSIPVYSGVSTDARLAPYSSKTNERKVGGVKGIRFTSSWAHKDRENKNLNEVDTKSIKEATLIYAGRIKGWSMEHELCMIKPD